MTVDPICSINSGQDFSWEMIDNTWYSVNGNNVLKIKIKDKQSDNFSNVSKLKNMFEFDSFPYYDGWEKKYFRLDDNFDQIKKSFSKDGLISELMEKYKGLRILRQEPMQCIFSFACASNNNIPRIKKMMKNMSKKFGEKIMTDNLEFFTFPTSKKLDEATNNQLKECGVGYRYKVIKTIANKIVNKELDFDYLKETEYNKAKMELLKVYGIGNKTADCVLLFSLEKLEAFPIDLWINRILNMYYQNLSLVSLKVNTIKHESADVNEHSNEIIIKKINPDRYDKIYTNVRKYFGRYCGYAQQYLYYHIRNNSNRKW